MPAASQRGQSSSQDLGRYRSASSSAWKVLPLHARGLFALLGATGLVDDPDGAERVGRECREDPGEVPLEGVAGEVVVPGGDDEELLEGADGGAADQGDRLDGLARQVGEQTMTVVVEVAGDAFLEEAAAVEVEVGRERGSEARDVSIGHGSSLPATPLILYII